jgi:hypothetical protein
MSFSEQYAAGMPLLVPTPRFMSEIQQRKKILRSRYWLNGRTRNMVPDYLREIHEEDNIDWWISRSDWYNHMSSVNYFDNPQDLERLIMTPPVELARPEEAELKRRELTILSGWRKLFARAGIV